MSIHRLAALLLLMSLVPGTAQAQNPPAAATPVEDADRDPNASQPDFTLVNLPTTLRLPRFKSAFRVTHRFTRSLGEGDFGDVADDLFGLDNGAIIGLEYRFGLMSGLQAGLLRTSGDKTIEFQATARIDTPEELVAFRHGGILPYVVRQLVGKN